MSKKHIREGVVAGAFVFVGAIAEPLLELFAYEVLVGDIRGEAQFRVLLNQEFDELTAFILHILPVVIIDAGEIYREQVFVVLLEDIVEVTELIGLRERELYFGKVFMKNSRGKRVTSKPFWTF